MDPFNPSEIQAILMAAEAEAKHLFQFAFYSGLRTSELMALQWEDVDWAKGTVDVRRALVRGRLKSPKTYAGRRTLLLLPPALEAIKAQRKLVSRKSKRSSLIFWNPNTGGHWSYDTIRKAWVNLLNKGQVRYRNPYQTRHTYASMMLSGGENIMWVANQMGHVDTQMVIKTYGKWIPDLSAVSGYRPLNDWNLDLSGESKREMECPADAPKDLKKTKKPLLINKLSGGERGIRTLDGVSPILP